mmetsp:Transcript_825/g.1962  ORF Transcript_825/g.1962 Transcript_825/m.1962 type:complete len:413 (+) Transcript_825:58-1296(+)
MHASTQSDSSKTIGSTTQSNKVTNEQAIMGEDLKEEKSCCTWPKVIIAVILLAVLGIVIWQFAPIDSTLDKVLPDFDKTFSPTVTPLDETMAPTSTPTQDSIFNRCSDDDTSCCVNGLSNICDLGVDDILYATVHNAMATTDDGFFVGPNHLRSFEGALQRGYRGLSLDLCNCNGVYQFCHGFCGAGDRALIPTMTSINTFLDDNPNEVLMIQLEITNKAGLEVDLNDFYALLTQIDGLTSKFYEHPAIDIAWPTLRDVVRDNKRILFFHYNGINCRDTPCPPGMHFWYEYAAETEFSFSSVDALRDPVASCTVTRGGNLEREPASRTFFSINNFVTSPSQSAAEVVNEYEFAKNKMAECKTQYNNLDANSILVDFWQSGDMVQLQQDTNEARGAAAARRRQRNQRHQVRRG